MLKIVVFFSLFVGLVWVCRRLVFACTIFAMDRNTLPVCTKGFHVFQFLLSGRLLSRRLLLVIMVAFSIASLNVDGIRDDDKRARIFEYLKSLKYDFFLLQETHIQTEDIEAWSSEWGALASGILVVINLGVWG